MMDMAALATFLGWCTVINIALYLYAAIWVIAFRGLAKRIHSRMLGVDEAALDALYFQFLGNYKLAIIFFNLVPYLALKIMG